ncbi:MULTISPECIES: GNAT family N-acetyltransferase [unclassified Paenibacillus]|uniref:GNAT family N-acetyltransferase n=1 Tax=unclassified Paenibacillus TaxID=185978 RepID=UPI002406A87B|nr:MULTISPECIES: GNAT family N-acetyltransferase [unclassified Paenibacillus]MDF9841293.1 N-acetylglutamate synthase-like GNAT family acetyltransferase [Paenibacillus sp. PastF-2]MDF9847884.1 N-acetylglutamate synthase-like GNAT family acetyltransferase [Paenibacillus sp. PastM-2]MDF9854452.1 N-acetylglutamate synthase-like GNAT family acetyltransferase [Paenibacillus sp. PastF-1]MDH6479939.1 N-acetylglutamate synthase-like GNAT family acetyltransferase [Paenibacillus sp. PastH-2]MDH6507159.1 
MKDFQVELWLREARMEDSVLVTKLIRESFQAQAQQLGLTEAEYPHYVAFEREKDSRERIIDTTVVVLYHLSNVPIGTIGYYAEGNNGIIERLAILPAYRGRSYGKELLQSAENDLFAVHDCQTVSISIAACFEKLQRYYESMKYVAIEKKKYPSLPFEVLHMQKTLDSWRRFYE